jgi:hypothetical protein
MLRGMCIEVCLHIFHSCNINLESSWFNIPQAQIMKHFHFLCRVVNPVDRTQPRAGLMPLYGTVKDERSWQSSQDLNELHRIFF